jgi:hypothetical protein
MEDDWLEAAYEDRNGCAYDPLDYMDEEEF